MYFHIFFLLIRRKFTFTFSLTYLLIYLLTHQFFKRGDVDVNFFKTTINTISIFAQILPAEKIMTFVKK